MLQRHPTKMMVAVAAIIMKVMVERKRTLLPQVLDLIVELYGC